MKNFVKLLGVIALAAVISFSMAACSDDGGSSNNNNPATTTEKTQLTGTVTVTQNVTFSSGAETMTLTADVSGLNGTSSNSYDFQWMKDGANISGATSATYVVKEADYGKAVSVKVTYLGYNYTGEQIGTFTVPNPTTLTLTLKKSSTTWQQETGITIERVDGNYWKSVSSGGTGQWGSLSATGATVTLSSWTETKFKMRTRYTFIDEMFYFKKENSAGSEEFDLTDGTKTYTLENQSSYSILTGLFAKEGT